MRVIVGLGNPGREYEETRHNVGFRAVQAFGISSGISIGRRQFRGLSGEGTWEGDKVMLLLPQTFMNRSGDSVSEAMRFYRLEGEDLLVVHDDLDLSLGRIKLDFDAGAAGHRGVSSVNEALGSQRYHRLRLGIGRPVLKDEVEAYVLSPFSSDEEPAAAGMVEEAARRIGQWKGGTA